MCSFYCRSDRSAVSDPARQTFHRGVKQVGKNGLGISLKTVKL